MAHGADEVAVGVCDGLQRGGVGLGAVVVAEQPVVLVAVGVPPRGAVELGSVVDGAVDRRSGGTVHVRVGDVKGHDLRVVLVGAVVEVPAVGVERADRCIWCVHGGERGSGAGNLDGVLEQGERTHGRHRDGAKPQVAVPVYHSVFNGIHARAREIIRSRVDDEGMQRQVLHYKCDSVGRLPCDLDPLVR